MKSRPPLKQNFVDSRERLALIEKTIEAGKKRLGKYFAEDVYRILLRNASQKRITAILEGFSPDDEEDDVPAWAHSD